MTPPRLTLAERPPQTLRWLLSAQGEPAALHAALTAEIARVTTPAHALLLAEPIIGPLQGPAWAAPGQRRRAFHDLPAADRQALTLALGAILSDLRRAVESGQAPLLAACWPGLKEIPGLDCLWAVDGRPVLACWGHAPAGAAAPLGLLARFDDGQPWQPPPRRPVLAWVATLGTLAALGLAAGLLLPMAGAAWAPALPQCRLDPASLAQLQEADRQAAARAGLEAELARLQTEIARRRLTCPLPQAAAPPPPPPPAPEPEPEPEPQPPPQPPPPSPPPPSPPPPRAELPQDRWEQGDLGLLEGCWSNVMEMRTRDYETGRVGRVRSWRLCFDRQGRGRQSLVWTDGARCDGPIRARFEGSRMRIEEPENCSAPGRSLYRARWECERLDDSEASCRRTDIEGPGRGNQQSGRFRR